MLFFKEQLDFVRTKGIIAVYPLGAFGSGKNGSSHVRAWQGAPYAKVSFTRIHWTTLQRNFVC